MPETPTTQPNLYQLQGGDIHIVYSTTGIDGRPHFNYQDSRGSLNFDGNDIETVASGLGTLVTVRTVMTVDTGSTSFTLVIPRVNLDQTNQAPVRTVGITALHRFSVIPAFNRGQTDLYTVTELSGTAEAVAF
jgi:hypothetical protein